MGSEEARPAGLALALVALLALVAACGGAQPAPSQPAATPLAAGRTINGEVVVFAAASLTEAFQEIGAALEAANPGARITFNFAGSAALRTQLAQGARADLFASADEPNMEIARREGAVAGEPRLFARNRLVIVVPARPTVEIADPHDLARPGVKLVLGTKELPAGNYARQVLANLGRDPAYGPEFAGRALANVVSEENSVKQIVAKVQLGEADAGIVYSSDVTPAIRAQVGVVAIPDEFNVVARYPIALVAGAANGAGAEAFVEHLLSPAGQAVLAKNGFLPLAASP